LGVEVQCAICTQRSWHSVDSLEYEILCPKCLSKFKLPVHNPATELKWSYKSIGPFALPAEDDRNHEDEDAGAKMEWSYRSLGPFASPKQASGAYCVLLSVGFLCDHHHPATTPVLSFKGTEDDGKELEADFMMFYRGLAFWENATEFVFGECKTFNRFKGIDIDRMKVISHDFPGAVLVFATLNDEFSAEEKDILIPFVNKCREYSKLDRPRNPVLLLTGTELFATFGPPRCWSDKAGKSKQFANARAYPHTLLELCDVTQQIYLDLDSWSKEWNEEFERRRRVGQKTIDGSEMQRIRLIPLSQVNQHIGVAGEI
jgi:hypothetical protein